MNQYKLWKANVQQLRESCRYHDSVWMKRKRRFDTFSVLSSVINLICNSKSSYVGILHEFDSELPPPSASAFCDARGKIPAYVFKEISYDLVNTDESIIEDKLWYGFNVFAMDGSTLNVPRPLEAEGFYVAPNNYYPHGLVTGLIRVEDRMICGMDFSSHKCERTAARRLLDNLGPKDLVLYDAGYLSYGMICDHLERGVNALFRIQPGSTFAEISEFKSSSDTAVIITLEPTKSTIKKARRLGLGGKIDRPKLRLMKFKVGSEEIILTTTLLSLKIPALEYLKLYGKRWRIEEFYKVFKNTVDIEEFHSKTYNGVEQEIHAACIVWNLSRQIESYAPPFKKSP